MFYPKGFGLRDLYGITESRTINGFTLGVITVVILGGGRGAFSLTSCGAKTGGAIDRPDHVPSVSIGRRIPIGRPFVIIVAGSMLF